MAIPADETDPERWLLRDDFALKHQEREALDEAVTRLHEVLLALQGGGRELHMPEQRLLLAAQAYLSV